MARHPAARRLALAIRWPRPRWTMRRFVRSNRGSVQRSARPWRLVSAIVRTGTRAHRISLGADIRSAALTDPRDPMKHPMLLAAITYALLSAAPALAQRAPAASPLAADIDKLAAALEPDLLVWRRHLHQHPELSNR